MLLNKDIEKGSRQLSKKLSKDIKIDKSSFITVKDESSITEVETSTVPLVVKKEAKTGSGKVCWSAGVNAETVGEIPASTKPARLLLIKNLRLDILVLIKRDIIDINNKIKRFQLMIFEIKLLLTYWLPICTSGDVRWYL